jgi:hypothetical protein
MTGLPKTNVMNEMIRPKNVRICWMTKNSYHQLRIDAKVEMSRSSTLESRMLGTHLKIRSAI